MTTYEAWVNADKAWQAELEREYGKHAGDARYDSSRQERTERLMELRHACIIARDAHTKEIAERRRHYSAYAYGDRTGE